jgi:hypothetical protein
MSNQLHNPSTFEHFVRPDSEVGDEHTNAPVLKEQWLHKATTAKRRRRGYLIRFHQLVEKFHSPGGTQVLELRSGKSEGHVRSIDGLDISHVENQHRSLRPPGFVARVAPVVPVQLQAPQPFYTVHVRWSNLPVVGEVRERTFQLRRVS